MFVLRFVRLHIAKSLCIYDIWKGKKNRRLTCTVDVIILFPNRRLRRVPAIYFSTLRVFPLPRARGTRSPVSPRPRDVQTSFAYRICPSRTSIWVKCFAIRNRHDRWTEVDTFRSECKRKYTSKRRTSYENSLSFAANYSANDRN